MRRRRTYTKRSTSRSAYKRNTRKPNRRRRTISTYRPSRGGIRL